MLVGIIPPILHLEDLAKGRKFHLILSHLLGDEDYFNFYRRQAELGAFITLDNSAHEHGQGQPLKTLLLNAKEVKASEVVLPDVLFNATETALQTVESVDTVIEDSEIRSLIKETQIKLMVVPQGENWAELMACLKAQVNYLRSKRELLFESGVSGFTLGLSKDYEREEGGLYRYVREAIRYKNAFFPEMNVHLLGWGRKLWELYNISAQFGKQIRSVDSSKPITYGYYRVELDPRDLNFPYPGRPKNFFDLEFTESQLEASRWNTRVFQGQARSSQQYLRKQGEVDGTTR